MVEPLHALVGQAAQAEQRPAIIDSIVTGVREEIRAGLAQDLGTLSEAVGTVIDASRPLSELVPAFTEAAAVIADNATGQTEALARLEEAIDRLAATDQLAELRTTLLPLAQSLSGSVASLSEPRGDLSAAVEKLVPALGGVESLAASIDAAAHSGSTASGAVADAARRLDCASQAIENAARELTQAARVPPELAGRSSDDRVSAS
jgi:methyl-accepting chemotaxis protein